MTDTDDVVVEQRSADWFAMRAGRFTGSKFDDVMARNKKTGEPLKAYYDLVWKLVVERLTGIVKDGVKAAALDWGMQHEAAARDNVALAIDREIDDTGFIVHPQFDFAGASPDGLIGAHGGLEMKCPYDPAVHLDRFVRGMPEEYVAQVQGGMWVTGRRWWLFASYDPRMPVSHQLYLQRIARDDAYIARLQQAVVEAEALVRQRLNEIDATVRAQADFLLDPD